ncbi:CLUMA_CG012385, isoform A [Clunio marinus]|uniref:CLUMA_CG012385, isoform A n=1 Tax=Clunio marinus TaxID=568069 RepID=A0A1J1IHI2_9DIPT|nr:CLUMA_CG012385, isoform A [Clunio marinus]
MESNKVTPQEIYLVLQQQKKLLELKEKVAGLLGKVNQNINLITVENLELASCQVENLGDEENENSENGEQSQINPTTDPFTKPIKTENINQQLIDLELNYPHYEDDEEDEEDFKF